MCIGFSNICSFRKSSVYLYIWLQENIIIWAHILHNITKNITCSVCYQNINSVLASGCTLKYCRLCFCKQKIYESKNNSIFHFNNTVKESTSKPYHGVEWQYLYPFGANLYSIYYETEIDLCQESNLKILPPQPLPFCHCLPSLWQIIWSWISEIYPLQFYVLKIILNT